MVLKNTVKRKLIQVAAFGFTNVHMGNFIGGKLYEGSWKQFCNPGLNCYSCPAANLACPIGSLQAVSSSMDFQFSFYVIGFLLAIGVLLGRFVCGFLCPFGLFQELLHKIPFPKIKLWKGFLYIKYFVLIVFVILLPIAVTNYMGIGKPAFCQFICPAGTLEGGIPLLATHKELQQTIGNLFSLKMIILILVIIGSLSIYRFFCKTLCPLGVIYGLLNKISIYHLEVNKNQCVDCGKCSKVCKMDVDPLKNPNSIECIRCGECVSECPVNAIHIGFKTLKKENKIIGERTSSSLK
ncbi:4Fe-4S binding protein [Anaerosacchariphilus polymeriproducens]|uniref:4Fe-4S binding protein n=1 Tax=Anaerosacchariphilus polymeriproducens TaxID=1812858 RepID=A0A371AW50_9FIRM|nr:4Fe-4S binding protein [Anaerosacchariphilus polymeriproducens]RDU23796.1 4Fe-4S binding protein [Anaerosacchariphilus polymeriproducens]